MKICCTVALVLVTKGERSVSWPPGTCGGVTDGPAAPCMGGELAAARGVAEGTIAGPDTVGPCGWVAQLLIGAAGAVLAVGVGGEADACCPDGY